jgi:hypothetical protein
MLDLRLWRNLCAANCHQLACYKLTKLNHLTYRQVATLGSTIAQDSNPHL